MADQYNFSDVMISYARENESFVRKLTERLEADQKLVWVDWQEIEKSAQWWAEIEAGIEATNVVVFIISPDSIQSDVCRREIQHAVDHSKRFIPMMYQSIDAIENKDQIHPAVSSHNWIFCDDEAKFEEAYGELIKALNHDFTHTRLHTRLHVRATEWQQQAKKTSYLLRGEDAHEAEIWLAAAVEKTPQPTPLQRTYIKASIAHEHKLEEEKRIQQERELSLQKQATRRLRYLVGVMGVSLVIALGLFALTMAARAQADAERARADTEREARVAERIENVRSEGVRFLGDGQFSEASLRFDELVELQPEDVAAQILYANALFGTGAYDEALIPANRAIELAPENSSGYLIRGQIHAAMGSVSFTISLIDRALDDFEQAITRQPDLVEAYFQRGLAYQQKSALQGEVGDFLRPPTLNEEQRDSLARAEENFATVLELDPTHTEAQVEAGNVALLQQDYERAINRFDQAIEVDPAALDAYGGRSVAYLNLGELDTATRDFNRFVSLQSTARFEQFPVALDDLAWMQYYGNNVFAYRSGRNFGYDRYSQGLHSGLDFGTVPANGDVTVYAGIHGVLQSIDTRQPPNTRVIINAGDFQFIYQHLDQIPDMAPGQIITPDTVLGVIEPDWQHVHIEVRYQSVMIVNPLYFFSPILIGDLVTQYPDFTSQSYGFYQDENWDRWTNPFSQPMIRLAGPVIGPRAATGG